MNTLANLLNIKKILVSNFDINKIDFITELDLSELVRFMFGFPQDDEIKEIVLNSLMNTNKEANYIYNIDNCLNL